MNNLIFYIILLLGNLSSFTNISERNTLKREALLAFQKGNFKAAAVLYQRLADATYFVEPSVRMDLAHAYFTIKDTLNAKIQYQRLLKVGDTDLRSTALTQLGVITTQNGDSTLALQLFKDALEKKPENAVARYDYEFLRKKLPKEKLPPPPKNQEQKQQKKQQEQQQNSGILEQSEVKKQNLKTIPPENVSKDKALQILDAMKSSEMQYIQQKKKAQTGKKNEKDW